MHEPGKSIYALGKYNFFPLIENSLPKHSTTKSSNTVRTFLYSIFCSRSRAALWSSCAFASHLLFVSHRCWKFVLNAPFVVATRFQQFGFSDSF